MLWRLRNAKTNLRAIAERANVSVASVSYVLNGKGRMSVEKRRQITNLLRSAGHKPKNRRKPVLYINDHDEYRDIHAFEPFLQKHDGLTAGFGDEKLTMRVDFLRATDRETLRSELSRLWDYRPGAVVIDSNVKGRLDAVAKFFLAHNVPVVQLGHVSHSPGIDAVVVDNFQGGYLAARRLASLGHKRIATIRWEAETDEASREKHAGFVVAMQELGLQLPVEYVQHTLPGRKDDVHPGRDAMERLLGLSEPPTAAFIENSFVSPSLLYPVNGECSLPASVRRIAMVHFEAWHTDWIEKGYASKLGRVGRNAELLRIDWAAMGRIAARRVIELLDKSSDTQPQTLRLAPRLARVEGFDVTELDTQSAK